MSEAHQEIMRAFIRAGVLGIVLAWALWENSKLVERVFVVIDNNTKALGAFERACQERLGGL